jgi:hypothetical protein
VNNHGADVEVGRWNQGEDGLRLLFGMSAARPKASCASPAVPTADRFKSNNLARLDRKVLVGFSFSAARHAIGNGAAMPAVRKVATARHPRAAFRSRWILSAAVRAIVTSDRRPCRTIDRQIRKPLRATLPGHPWKNYA